MVRLYETPQEKEAFLNQTRQKNFEESRFDPNRPRYGLFSYTGTLAISEDSIGRKSFPPRGEDGQPILNPRNFQTTGVKKGKGYDAYFSPPQFVTVGDKYTDPAKPQLYEKERAAKMRETHEGAIFKPDGPIKEPYSIYNHESDYVERKINRKLPDGTVAVGPRNFVTNPPRLGSAASTPGLTLGKYPLHQADPYNRKRELEKLEYERNKAKLQEQPFKSMAHGNRNFFNDQQTYKDVDVQKKPRRPNTFTGVTHDKPFIPANPSKRGVIDKTLSRYPEYKEDPYRVVTRKPPREEVPWRTTYKGLSKPSPSIVRMGTNARSLISISRRLR